MSFDGDDSQTFQISKFAISLQYLKKEVRDKVDFFHADKHEVSYQLNSTLWASNFLQGDTIIIDGHDQGFSKCLN